MKLIAQRFSVRNTQMTVSPSGREFCLYLLVIVPVQHKYVAKASAREKFPVISNSLLSRLTSIWCCHVHCSVSILFQSILFSTEGFIIYCVLIAFEKWFWSRHCANELTQPLHLGVWKMKTELQWSLGARSVLSLVSTDPPLCDGGVLKLSILTWLGKGLAI